MKNISLNRVQYFFFLLTVTQGHLKGNFRNCIPKFYVRTTQKYGICFYTSQCTKHYLPSLPCCAFSVFLSWKKHMVSICHVSSSYSWKNIQISGRSTPLALHFNMMSFCSPQTLVQTRDVCSSFCHLLLFHASSHCTPLLTHSCSPLVSVPSSISVDRDCRCLKQHFCL